EPHVPTKGQVVVELLNEQPLAAHAVEHLQQQRPQESLGGDRGPAHARVQLAELWLQLRQDRIDHGTHRPQGMCRRHTLLQGDVAPHLGLRVLTTTHARLLAKSYAHRKSTLTLTRHPKSGFSAAC